MLLAADGLARVLEEALARFLPSQPLTADRRPPTANPLLPTAYCLLPILAIVLFWAGPALEVAMGQGTGGMDTASNGSNSVASEYRV